MGAPDNGMDFIPVHYFCYVIDNANHAGVGAAENKNQPLVGLYDEGLIIQ